MSDNLGKKKDEKQTRLTVDQRSTIIRRIADGETQAKLAKEYNVTVSAISKINHGRERILKAQSDLEKCKGNVHKKFIKGTEESEVEKQLHIWFKQQQVMGLSVSLPSLQEKALFFHKHLGEERDFMASKDWLFRFTKRHGINLRHVSKDSEMLSTDTKTSDELLEKIRNIVDASGSSVDHTYSCDETELFWKVLPDKSFAFCKNKRTTESKQKPKNRVTIMMCSNGSGSHKLPLFIIGKSAHPRCLGGITNLPVIYNHQENACIDKNLMIKWYSSVFIPEVDKKHDLQNNSDIQIILLMDNALCHPSEEELNAKCASHKILILQPHVESLIQTINQGIISNFKEYYRKSVLTRILAKRDYDDFPQLFNLLDCCNFCAHAWNEVTPATIRNCWKNIFPLENDPNVATESVDIASLHSLIIQIPGMDEITFEETAYWVDIDSEKPGWQLYSDEDNLFGQSSSSNIENVVEEWDDKVVYEDQEVTEAQPSFIKIEDESGVSLFKIKNDPDAASALQDNEKGLQEAYDASETLLKWYQTHENNTNGTMTMYTLLELNQILAEEKAANFNHK